MARSLIADEDDVAGKIQGTPKCGLFGPRWEGYDKCHLAARFSAGRIVQGQVFGDEHAGGEHGFVAP